VNGLPPQPRIAGELRQVPVGGDAVTVFGEERDARVAVCIPVRNAEATLERCLDSVLSQEGIAFRVVVVDNASTDGTFALACARAAGDPRVLVYRNPHDVGRIENWNRCLELAGETEYVKLLMAGDLLLPGYLAETAAMLDAFPSAVLLRASLSFREADGRVDFLPHFACDRLIAGEEARRSSLVEGNIAAGPSGQLWRRSALAGLAFDAALPWAADYDFSLRLLRRGDFAYLRRHLYLFDLGAARFHSAADPVTQLADECAVAMRHGAAGALPRLEALHTRLGGGPELDAILDETRAALAPKPLDTRGVSLLLELDGPWEQALCTYLDEIHPEEDVTLVVKPPLGSGTDSAVAAIETVLAGHAETPDLLLEPSELPPSHLTASVDAVLSPGDSPRALVTAARPTMPRTRPRVHVVMPIGVGAPGTPVIRHLRASLDCLARQTFRDFEVTVAADENISGEARSLVEAYGAELVWYPKDTYFRPGGIWKKITDQWQRVESDYVAYFHYDDLWETTKLAEQVALIESRALNGCYTAGERIDDDGVVTPGDIALPALEPSQAGTHPGAWTLHSMLLRRDAILGSGLLEHEQSWAAIFEQLFFLYVLKLGRVEKCTTTRFFYREHPATISNTVREEEAFVEDARAETGYTLEATLADADAIDLDGLAARLVAGAV
jgi:glycosyltransferase involved in cell wall biosynthesis